MKHKEDKILKKIKQVNNNFSEIILRRLGGQNKYLSNYSKLIKTINSQIQEIQQT